MPTLCPRSAHAHDKVSIVGNLGWVFYFGIVALLVFAGFSLTNDLGSSVLLTILFCGIFVLFGQLFVKGKQLDPKTRRYRNGAILGLIFFLGWISSLIG